MGRILGIDYGDVRIGVAVSDISGTIANPLKSVRNKRGCIEEIETLCNELDIEQIVVGYPKNMNGTLGENCKKVDEFCVNFVEQYHRDVVKWDERLSTVAIHGMLAQTGMKVGKDKGKVDTMAAVYILQGYLDYCRNKKKEGAENYE